MGQTAERLLELLEQYGGDEKQILRENRELEYFYALSDMRENLLEWYPFGREDALLQIGSGFGAMTGLFAARAGEVTVLDGDEEDLAVNRRRHGGRDNINYVNCTPDEYAARAAKGGETAPGGAGLYDCVTLVDGLGENPEETIALAKEKGAHAVLVLENGSERRVEL